MIGELEESPIRAVNENEAQQNDQLSADGKREGEVQNEVEDDEIDEYALIFQQMQEDIEKDAQKENPTPQIFKPVNVVHNLLKDTNTITEPQPITPKRFSRPKIVIPAD